MKTTHTKKFSSKVVGKNGLASPHLLFDTAHGHGMCMLDASGRIVSWNVIAEKMLGYIEKEVVGKSYGMFFTKEEKRRKIFEKAIATATKTDRCVLEGVRVRKDGSQFWARSFITLVKKGKSGTIFFVLVSQDITQEKEQEQKREEYIGIASHELKNPITTLSLYSELLAKRLELDRDKKNLNMLRDIQDQAAHLVTLVNDLLVVSKIESGKLELHKEVFNPNTFFRKIIQRFNNTTSTHAIVCVGKISSDVRADKDRMAQVFTNLLTNAIKYSPQARKVHVRIVRQKNKCVVSVQDFGPGIPKKDQRELFTRFFRVSTVGVGNVPGLGLGLYISKQIIQKHRERIWVKSTEGKGATFFFTLSLV